MYPSKKLNGTSSKAPTLTAGEGISILSNEIHIDDTVVATDTQLTAATGSLVTASTLNTAISTFVSDDELTAATGSFVTQGDIDTATSGLASHTTDNTFTKLNTFTDRTYFNSIYVQSADDIHGGAAGIAVFRELELLRSHFTSPTWVAVTLGAPYTVHTTAGRPPTVQISSIQYGTAKLIHMRGLIKRTLGTFFVGNEVITTLDEMYRPAYSHQFTVNAHQERQRAQVTVGTDGTVTFIGGASDENIWGFNVDQISFFTN